MTGMGSHHSTSMKEETWLTPPYIIQALGPFCLDPCAATDQPWSTAVTQFTKPENGLARDWFGFVWCNPPYGRHTGAWLNKLADHGNGLALIFARTETAMFFFCTSGSVPALCCSSKVGCISTVSTVPWPAPTRVPRLCWWPTARKRFGD